MKRTSLLLSFTLAAAIPLCAQDAPSPPAPAKAPAETPAKVESEAKPALKATPKVERNIRFQFDGIPYADVLERFAQMADKPLIADGAPEGALTFHDSKPYNFAEALDTLNVILATKGFALVEDDHYLRLTPLGELSRVPLKILQGSQDAAGMRPEEIVTVVLSLKNLQAPEIATSITNMLTKAGSVAPLSQGRGLILTDRLANIRRIESLINTVDTEAILERQMKSFTLVHSSGAVLQDLLTRTFGKESAPKKIHFNPATKRTEELAPDPSQYITAVYDEASRTMILFGPQDRMEMAEELINEFENREGGAGEVRIYFPQLKTASELSDMLRQAVPGIASPKELASTAATKARLIVDDAENRLIVAAPLAAQADQIENVINSLDLPVHGKGDASDRHARREIVQLTKVFEVRTLDIAKAEGLLKQVLSRKLPQGGWGVAAQITVDANTKTVVVSGSPGDIQKVEDIIRQIEGERQMAGPRSLKIFPLKNTRAAAIAANAEQLITERMNDPRFERQVPPSVIPDESNIRLLVTATAEQMEAIEEVVTLLDVAPTAVKRALSMLPVKTKTPTEMIALVSELTAQLAADRADPKAAPKLFPDEASKQIVLLAAPDDAEKITTLVRQLDSPAMAKVKKETRGIELFGRKAEELTPLVQQLYEEQIAGAQEPEGGPATLLAEARDNRILVTGTDEQIERVEALVRQLDPEGSKPRTEETRVFALQAARATDLTSIVQQAVLAQSPEAKILTDTRSNSLVVTGDTAALDAADKLIQQLDKRPRIEPREMRVIDLNQADAATLATMVETVAAEMLADSQGPDYTPQTRVVPDAVGQRLVLSGPRDELVIYASVIEQLDKPGDSPGGARVFQLQNSDADQVAEILTQAMSTIDTRGRPVQRVSVSTDRNSNSLVVAGDREDLKDAEIIIQKLDGGDATGGPRGGNGSFNRRQRGLKVFDVADGDAASLAKLAQNVFQSQNVNRPGVDQVSFTSAPDGRQLIVMAPDGLLEQVETVVNLLNTRPAKIKRALQRVETKGHSGADVVKTVQQIYAEQSRGLPGEPATLYPDPSGEGLMVYGSDEQAEQIRQIVSTLSSVTPEKRQTRMIEVGSVADAEQLLPLVQQIYRNDWENKPADDPADAQIVSDGRTGRLIVSGREQHVAAIERIVGSLVPAKPIATGRETRIFNVGNSADVQRLQPLVEQLYTDQWKDKAGADPADAQILADTRLGRLIVTGKPEHVEEIGAIIEQLGAGEPAVAPGKRETKVLNLKSGNAGEVKQLVEQLYADQARERFGDVKPDTLILADDENNRLVVAGDSAEIKAVAEIVSALEVDAADGGSARIFVIKHADPQTVARILSMAISGEDTSNPFMRYYRFSRYRPSNAPKQFSAMADAATRSVIVSGEPKDIQAAASIIDQLDQPADTSPRRMRVVEVGPKEARTMVTQVKSLFEDQAKSRPELRENEVLVMEDSSGDRIVIAGNDEQLQVVDEILETLAPAEMKTAQRETKVYDIQAADAFGLATIVRNLYEKQLKTRATRPDAEALIMEDRTTNRLIVSAIPEEMKAIDDIVTQLDKASPREDTVRFFKLENANPDDLAAILKSVIVSYNSRGYALPKVTATIDRATGMLVVAGAPDDLKLAAKVIEDYDRDAKGPDVAPRQMKVVNVGRDRGKEILVQVQALFDDQAQARPELRKNEVLLMEGSERDQIVIGGNDEQLKLVEEILATIAPPTETAERETRVYDIQAADADNLATVIRGLYEKQLRSRDTRPNSEALILDDRSTNRILVSATPEEMKAIDAIITELDKASPREDAVRFFKLQNANPDDLAAILKAVIVSYSVRGVPLPKVTATTDRATGTLVVAGAPNDLKLAAQLIEDYDRDAKGPDVAPRRMKVVNVGRDRAKEMVVQVRSLYEDQSQARPELRKNEVLLMEGAEGDQIVIGGNDDQLKLVEEILATIAPPTETAKRETRVYDIQAADADDLAVVIRGLYEKQLRSRDTRPSSEALILDDRSTNRILVSATPEEMKAIDQIITELDKASPREDTVRFFKLNNADPDDLRSVLQSVIVRYNSRGIPLPKVTATVDRAAGTLIVTGDPDDLKLASKLVEEYDGSAIPREERVMRFVKTADADPDDIAKQLENLYQAEMKSTGKAGRADAIFMGDDDGKRLIITARKSDMTFIDETLGQMEEAWADTENRVQLFTLEHAPATPIADMIVQLFDKRANKRKGEPTITTTPSPDDRSVLVDTDAETLARVADLVETLDKPRGDGTAVIQTIHLATSEAAAVALAVNESLNAKGADPKLKEVSVTAVEGTKALLLNGPGESVEEVTKIVKEIDEGSSAGEVEVRVYQLQSTSARDVEPVLRQLLASVASSGSPVSTLSRLSRSSRYYTAAGQPSIAVQEEANRLLVTAKPDQFKLVEKLLQELDKAPQQSDRDVQFVWLKTADAFEVVDLINAFYSDRAARDRPTLEADYAGDQITIIAKRSDMPQIKDLIQQFDQGIVESDLQIRMLSLSRVPVEEMAEMLKTLYPQMYSGNLRFVEKLEGGIAPLAPKPETRKPEAEQPKPDAKPDNAKPDAKKPDAKPAASDTEAAQPAPEVVISVDKKANMLLLSGPATELDRIDEIIAELEWFALPGDSDLHVYPLKKADPEVVARTLNELFRYEAQALAAQAAQAAPKTGAAAKQAAQSRTVRPPKMVVVPEPRTRSIIVRASPTDYLVIESLIEQLDQAGEVSKIVYRLIPLKNAPAAKLAPMITLMAKQMKAAQPGDAVLIEPYDRNRSLLVIGRAPVIDEVEAMIEDLDIPATDEEIEVSKLELEHADAAAVARTVTLIFSSGAQLRAGAQGEPELGSGKALFKSLNVAADSRLNTVFLSGPKEAVALAERIVADMDRKQEGFLTEVKLIQLRYASASKILPLLQAVFTEGRAVAGSEGVNTFVTRLQTDDKEGRELTSDQPKTRAALVLQADQTLNILVIAARSDTLPLIEAVVKQLDIPEASGMATVRIYPMEHADATSVRGIITQMYAGSMISAARTADRPNIMADVRSNSLVVAGTDNAFAMIDSLIAMLDTELSLEMRDIHILPLEHADANELARSIQNLMDSRIPRLAGAQRAEMETHRVMIIAEPRSNSLLVAGGKDAFELVESLAKQLDAAAPALSGTIRLLPLNFADARTVAASFNSLFSARYAATRAAARDRNKPVIVADARINALLITAAMDDNEIIDDLLPKLDRKLDNPALLLTVVSLKHNDAATVSTMLESIFAARLKSRAVPGQVPSPSEAVNIEVDALNNTMIVSSNKENLEVINDLLKQIDNEPMMTEGVFETFTLEHADAQRVASLIQSLIQQGLYRPGRPAAWTTRSRTRGAGDALAVAVDPRSNTLIVSASPENLSVVKEVIRQVDTADFAQGGDIRFYKLEHAQASDLAVTLNSFFQSKRQADSVAINSPERSIPVSIIPDDRINTLLVTGSKEAFDTLDRILPDLDGEDQISRQNFKVIPLKNATATALRDTLEQLFANRPAPVKGQRPDPITLVADAWVNALIVAARVHDMTMVESMIEQLDSEQAELGLKVEVIPVLKADVERIAETVRELYRESAGRASKLPVFVNPDERLSALVVSGGETDIKRIREVVQKLDTTEVSRVNEIRVIPLEHARADSLATILSSALNDKPDSLEGGRDDSQSVLQFVTSTDDGEKFVTSALHEAVLITPDTRMNSLIVSGPVDYMGLLERVVKRLDDASPREAQIRVFELKHSEARNVGQLLLGLFRMTPSGAPAAGNDRSVEYTLYQPSEAGDQAIASAVVGSEEQSALRISIDPRSNSVLVGGSEHYIKLVSEVIQTLDADGGVRRKSQVYRLKNAQAEDISTAIRDFLDQDRQRITQALGQDAVRTAEALLEKEVAIVAEPISNTLLLSAQTQYFDTLNDMIEELDRPQPQVLVQVLLAEITVDAMRDLGVEWNYTKTLGGNWDFGTGTDFGVPAELATLGGYSALVTGNNFNFLIRALENDGNLEILSRPQILTADNQPASINIGQRVPLITGSQITPQGGVNNQFDYRDVGVSLAVTPRIIGDGFVQIDVQTTNSSISSSSVQINADATVPIINERRASTMVSVQSGQTVVIGGLISASEDKRQKKMPLLGSIPLLGNLFKNSRNVSDRKELLVLLTPQILNAEADPADEWTRNIKEFSDDMIRDSSMNNVFKDDKTKRAMFERVFPDGEEPEKASEGKASGKKSSKKKPEEKKPTPAKTPKETPAQPE